MEDAKMKILQLTMLLSIAIGYVKAQQINGRYTVKNPSVEESRILTFADGKFSDTTSMHLGMKRIGQGTYKLLDKNLIMSYLPVENRDSSVYKLAINDGSGKSGALSVRVSDEIGAPMRATVVLLNKENQVLVSFFTDKGGTADLHLFEALSTGHLIVDFLGYHRVSIPIKVLLAKRSDLAVQLMPAEVVYIGPKKEVYNLSSHSPSVIVMSSKDAGTLILRNGLE